MKCSIIRTEIDRLGYEDNLVMGHGIQRHIDSCAACSRYLKETRQSFNFINELRRREPNINDPELLTENILAAVNRYAKENNSQSSEKQGKLRSITTLQRILAAASVCLFLVFGYEEYIVIDKIAVLEKQNAAISRSSKYQTAIKLNKTVQIFASDPAILNSYFDVNTKKIILRKLLGASMYADVTGIFTDAVHLQDRPDYQIALAPFLSILNQLDSTD